MILFFRTPNQSVIATQCNKEMNADDIKKLSWLYGNATVEKEENLQGWFIGPRREMITPWSTNAVEITQKKRGTRPDAATYVPRAKPTDI